MEPSAAVLDERRRQELLRGRSWKEILISTAGRTDAEALYLRLRALLALGRHREAADLAGRVLDWPSSDPSLEGLALVARAYVERAARRHVERGLTRILREEPGLVGPKLDLARLLAWRGEQAKARELLHQVVAAGLDPMSAMAEACLLLCGRQRASRSGAGALRALDRLRAAGYPRGLGVLRLEMAAAAEARAWGRGLAAYHELRALQERRPYVFLYLLHRCARWILVPAAIVLLGGALVGSWWALATGAVLLVPPTLGFAHVAGSDPLTRSNLKGLLGYELKLVGLAAALLIGVRLLVAWEDWRWVAAVSAVSWSWLGWGWYRSRRQRSPG